MQHLAPLESYLRLDLPAVPQKLLGVPLLELIIMLRRIRSELDGLQDNLGLFLLGFFRPLALFILELAIIHDSADRRIRVGRHLYQIQPYRFGTFQTFSGRNDTELLIVFINNQDFLCPNLAVYSVLRLPLFREPSTSMLYFSHLHVRGRFYPLKKIIYGTEKPSSNQDVASDHSRILR